MLKHILKHCCWWPLEFILQPHSIIDRADKDENAERVSALIGGSLWGALIGCTLWFVGYGDIHSIWILPCVAVAVFVAVVVVVVTVIRYC